MTPLDTLDVRLNPMSPPLTLWDPRRAPLDVPLDPQTKPDYEETKRALRLLQSLPLVFFKSYHTVHFISWTFLGQFGLVFVL